MTWLQRFRRFWCFWLLLLAVGVPQPARAACPIIVDNGTMHWLCDMVFDGITNFPKVTTGAMSLYVRTTGSDANDCLAAGTACLTVQAALNKVPQFIGHAVTVDIGAGTFDGFTIRGFQFQNATGALSVSGALALSTLATGTNSGTATGGTTTLCVDAGQAWTASDLVGRMVLVGSEYRAIRANDATSVTLVGALSGTCNGAAYSIREAATIVNTESESDAVISVSNVSGYAGAPKVTLQNFRVNTPAGATYGLAFWQGNSPTLTRIRVVAATAAQTDFYWNGAGDGQIVANECVAQGGDAGFRFINATSLDSNNMNRIFVNAADNSGVYVNGGNLNLRGTWHIQNCLGSAVKVVNAGTFVRLSVVGGSSNTRFGLEVEDGAYVQITTDTRVAGGLGNASIDDGHTPLSWTLDFATNLSAMLDSTSGSRIRRRD